MFHDSYDGALNCGMMKEEVIRVLYLVLILLNSRTSIKDVARKPSMEIESTNSESSQTQKYL